VRKVSIIVSVAEEGVVPAGILSEIHMAFRGFRDVQLEFVVVGQSPSSALSMVSRDSDFVVLFDTGGNYNPQDVGRVVAPLLSGEADVTLGSEFGVFSRTVMAGLKLPAVKIVEVPISSRPEVGGSH
jgi:hypothetical protein